MTAAAPLAPVAPIASQVSLHKCQSPSGAEVEVQGLDEERRYNEARDHYMHQATFTQRSDLEDLDRILFMELMVYRWGRALMRGQNLDGTVIYPSDEKEIRRSIQDWSDRIQKTKESLKLDRKGREGDQAINIQQKWELLASHAKELGVVRVQQSVRAIEVLQDMFAIIAAFDRSDVEERKKLGFESEADIVQYMRESRPHYDEIDQYFRQNSHRYWVRNP